MGVRGWTAERGQDDDSVCEQEVAVAFGDSGTVDESGGWGGESIDFEVISARVGCFLQDANVLLKAVAIGIGWYAASGGDDCIGFDETGELVDVSVGVIAEQTAAVDPDRFADAQLPHQFSFNHRLGPARITKWTEKAAAGGEKRFLPICLQRSTFAVKRRTAAGTT